MRDEELFGDWISIPARSDPEYYRLAMDAGNKLRKDTKRPDALAALAIATIAEMRETLATGEASPLKRAYIVSSLKRPEEVSLLKSVYGAAFFLISAYAPRSARVDRLAALLAHRSHENRSSSRRDLAEKLIRRDEKEEDEFGEYVNRDYGQDVGKTYPLADLFVSTTSVRQCNEEISRFVSLIFGDPWRTPTRDEQGMSFAFLASLRSGSPARQVGASLTDESGTIISIGMNEVASPNGGQYWEGDEGDGRDFLYDRQDKSDLMRTNLLTDVLARLRTLDVLVGEKGAEEQLLAADSDSQRYLRESLLFDTIDFVRAVHAEASALLAASGRTKGSTLYVTTFPCHECARHIVFAGVSRVVYVEPYPKSLVAELYKDSVSVDSGEKCVGKVSFVPFTGVSPSVYRHLFSLWNKKRKGKDGILVQWNATTAVPRLESSYSEEAAGTAETEVLGWIEPVLKLKGRADGATARVEEGMADISSE